MVSHPSGKPASVAGKGSWRSWIRSPDFAARSTIVLSRDAKLVVVIMVTVTPCCDSSLAMSIMGIRWPWPGREAR